MSLDSNDRLNGLLRSAYPGTEVSGDFRVQLWRKLMQRPVTPLWKVPAPALAAALLLGVIGGIWSGLQPQDPSVRVIARLERWDLFGNAPHDSLAGTVLRQMRRADA